MIANSHCFVDRNGERNSLVPARAAVDHGIDADDFTFHIDQWPARVAGIDGDIGLDEWHVFARIAAFCADYSRRDRVVQIERRAYGHHPFAHTQAAGVSYGNEWQAGRLHLDDGNIGTLINAKYLRLEFALVRQPDINLVGAAHHMGVCHDATVGGKYESRPHTGRHFVSALAFRRGTAPRPALASRRTHPREEFAKRILLFRAGCPARPASKSGGGLRCPDVYNCRSNFVDQIGEVRQHARLRASVGRKLDECEKQQGYEHRPLKAQHDSLYVHG